MSVKKVGRPKKTVRNPFIFTGGIVTNPLKVIGKVFKNEKKNGEFTFETVTIDQEKNDVHISPDLLLKFSNKGADTTETAIFLHILSKLYNGREQVKLDPEVISIETGFPIQRISRSLGNLSKEKIIKRQIGRQHNYIYWINPNKIFQGNRVKYIKAQSKNEDEFNRYVEKIEKKDKQALDAISV